MRPYQTTITGSGTSAPFPLDYISVPFNVTVGCVVSGAPVYTVQYTLDDPWPSSAWPTSYSASATWFPIGTSSMSGGNANAVGNFAFPVRAARITTSGATNTTTTFYLIQGLQGL